LLKCPNQRKRQKVKANAFQEAITKTLPKDSKRKMEANKQNTVSNAIIRHVKK